MSLQSWCIGKPSLVYFVESIHDNYSQRGATTGGYTGTIPPANTAVVVLSLVVVFVVFVVLVVLLVPMLVLVVVLFLLFSTFPALLVVVVFLLLSTSPSVVV